MLIGLTLLQSLYGLSEDEVVNRWPENPYWRVPRTLVKLRVELC